MKRIRKYFFKIYSWYGLNVAKIIFVVGLHFISSYVVNLPYINILTGLFSFLPYFFDWLAILILFKPSKNQILKIGISLFILGFPLALIRLNFALEVLGQASFFAIGTYVIMSLREIRK